MSSIGWRVQGSNVDETFTFLKIWFAEAHCHKYWSNRPAKDGPFANNIYNNLNPCVVEIIKLITPSIRASVYQSCSSSIRTNPPTSYSNLLDIKSLYPAMSLGIGTIYQIMPNPTNKPPPHLSVVDLNDGEVAHLTNLAFRLNWCPLGWHRPPPAW